MIFHVIAINKDKLKKLRSYVGVQIRGIKTDCFIETYNEISA